MKDRDAGKLRDLADSGPFKRMDPKQSRPHTVLLEPL